MNKKRMRIYDFHCVCGDLQFMEAWKKTLPIFYTGASQSRKAYGNEYFFLDTTIRKVDKDLWLYTEFVKKEEFTSNEIYNSSTRSIERKKQRLELVSSSYLAIRLNDNKLIWIENNSNSPSINEFRATYKVLLKRQLTNTIRDIKAETGESFTSLYKKYVEGSDVEILHFPSKGNVESQIDSLQTLKKVSIEVSEFDFNSHIQRLWKNFTQTSIDVVEKNTSISFVSMDGLCKDKVLELFLKIPSSTILQWRLHGEGVAGSIIETDSETVRLTSSISLRGILSEHFLEMISAFGRLESTGFIPKSSECSNDAIEDVIKLFDCD